jgi:hypothetical protein
VSRRSLAELSDSELLAKYRAEIAGALHWQEFAELPVVKGHEDSHADSEERFRLAVCRAAAVRRHALSRSEDQSPDALSAAYPWPWGRGYEEALAELDRRLARRDALEAAGSSERGGVGDETSGASAG